MSPERARLARRIEYLTGLGMTTREAAKALGISVSKLAGIMRDVSDVKREANNARRSERKREEAA